MSEILIGENNLSTIERMNMLLGGNFGLTVREAFDELLSATRSSAPRMILVNNALLIDEDSTRALFDRAPSVVYGDKMDLNEKLRFYRYGARRVVALPADSAHQACLWIRNVFKNPRPSEGTSTASSEGLIDAATVPELFFNAMIERKDVIIKTHYQRWQASAKFYDGQIVGVSGPREHWARTLQKMLLVTSGVFKSKPMAEPSGEVTSEISVWSQLVQAQFDRRAIQDFADNDPSAVRIRLNNHYQPDETLPVSDGDTLLQALLGSALSCGELLDKLKDCRNSGSLWIDTGQPRSLPESRLDLGFVQEKLFPAARQQGGLLVFGPPEIGRSKMIRAIAGSQAGEYQATQVLEFTRITVGEGKNLTIIGISVEENILPVLEKVSGGMLAAIFLADTTDRGRAEFTGYLVKQVQQMYGLPVAVGLVNYDQLASEERIKPHKIFGFSEDVVCVTLGGDPLQDLKLLLENLPAAPEEAEND